MKKIPIIIIIILVIVGILLGLYIYKTKPNKPINNIKYDGSTIRVDASLATQPLMDAFVDNLTEYKFDKKYTNTDPAYKKLINNETDLIIVTYPSSDEQKLSESSNIDLDITPVVNEAFVFFTNKNNPVSSLKLSEIQDIYSGKITNWKEVGGSDAKIIAYQRPINSGSQTGMLNMVMKGKNLKEASEKETIQTMAGIIDVISAYDTGVNGIGYSYYYYANTMYGNDSIKFLGIDGVTPNNDSIAKGEYKLNTNYYIVTRKNDTKVKPIINAMLSDKGQAIAEKAGYVRLLKNS